MPDGKGTRVAVGKDGRAERWGEGGSSGDGGGVMSESLVSSQSRTISSARSVCMCENVDD